MLQGAPPPQKRPHTTPSRMMEAMIQDDAASGFKLGKKMESTGA